MSLKPATREAYKLLQDGTLAMIEIERAGIRIDSAYLDRSIKEVTKQVAEMESQIRDHKIIRTWQKHMGKDFKLGSRAQLGEVIFDILGNKRNPHLSEKSNNELAFKHLSRRIPFLAPDGPYFGIAKLTKALNTNLIGLQREVVDGYVHPMFSLFLAESYRPSCQKPNFQNQPRRNKKIAEIVRKAVIPRKGRKLLSADYGQQEVRVAACYTKDPKLIEYVTGGGDQHYDAAKDIYLLTDEEIGSIDKGQPGADVRDIVKNKYVFRQNYGGTYIACVPDLWEMIEELDLRTAQGVSLYDHLRSKGIKRMGTCDREHDPRPGTFERHVRKAEQAYWDRLKVYKQWREDFWALYQRQGGVNTLTGFCMHGLFQRNQIWCDPIQGSAFHCLLLAIILIQKELRKRKMKAKIIDQIHDSILGDVPDEEVDDFVEIVHRIMTKTVPKLWPWIIVPLKVDFEIGHENWYAMEKLKAA